MCNNHYLLRAVFDIVENFVENFFSKSFGIMIFCYTFAVK